MSAIVAELYDALRKAGVDEELAKSAARAVLAAEAREDLATKADVADLKAVTRADLAELRGEMAALQADLKADMAALRAELKADMAALRAELKADITQVKTDMADLKTDLIKWNVGAMAVMTGIFAAIVRLT